MIKITIKWTHWYLSIFYSSKFSRPWFVNTFHRQNLHHMVPPYIDKATPLPCSSAKQKWWSWWLYQTTFTVSLAWPDCFFLLYSDGKKGSGEQPIQLLFWDPQNLGMLLIGGGLKNKGSLIGENRTTGFSIRYYSHQSTGLCSLAKHQLTTSPDSVGLRTKVV